MSAVNVLNEIATTINKAAVFITDSTNDWQVIQAYMANRMGDIKLSAKQQEQLNRYQFIYNQLSAGKFSEDEVISSACVMFGIEDRQVYKDLKATKELFSTTVNVNKRFELNVQLQVNRRLQRKAEEINDLKAVAAFEKNRIALLALIEDEEFSPDIFTGHVFEGTFDPSLIGAEPVDMKDLLTAINSKRKVKIKTELFTDIAYEEVDTPE